MASRHYCFRLLQRSCVYRHNLISAKALRLQVFTSSRKWPTAMYITRNSLSGWEQFTRRFITFHRRHGVKRTRGNLLFSSASNSDMSQSTIRIAFVAFILVHHRLIVTSDKHQRSGIGYPRIRPAMAWPLMSSASVMMCTRVG